MDIEIRQLRKYAETATDLLEKNGIAFDGKDIVKVASFLIERDFKDVEKVAEFDAMGRIVARTFHAELGKFAYGPAVAQADKTVKTFGEVFKGFMGRVGKRVAGKKKPQLELFSQGSTLRERAGSAIAQHPYISAGAATGATALGGAALFSD